MKTYWWVSVGGSNCEPAVVTGEIGSREAFTFGCPDPFKVDEVNCPLKLIEAITDDNIPLTPRQEQNALRRQ